MYYYILQCSPIQPNTCNVFSQEDDSNLSSRGIYGYKTNKFLFIC